MTYCEVKVAGEPTEKLPRTFFFNMRGKTNKHGSIFFFPTKEESASFVPKIQTILTYRGQLSSSQPCVSRQKRSC